MERFKIVGMDCASCALAIEKKVKNLNGVLEFTIDQTSEEAIVVYDIKQVKFKDVVKAVRDAGYDVVKEDAFFLVDDLGEDNEEVLHTALLGMPGIIDVKSSPITKTVKVVYNPYVMNANAISEKLKSLGFAPEPLTEKDLADIEKKAFIKEIRESKITLPLSLSIGLTYFTYSMISLVSRWNPLAPYDEYIGFLAATAVILLNLKIFFRGFKTLIKLTPTMDSLISLGVGTAYIAGVAALAGLMPHLGFFEAPTGVLAFVSLGNYIESLMKVRAGEAVKKLKELQPKTVKVVREVGEVEVPLDDLRVGDVVIVKAGDVIAVDGVVVEGEGYVDESLITGESLPVFKSSDRSPVISGSILKSGYLKIRVTRVGKDTTLSQVIELVRYAQMSKPRLQRLIDRISGYFTWLVMILSVTAFAYGYFILHVDISLALIFSIATLVTACPCALGIATPIVVYIGVGKASELGFIIRNIDVIEDLPKVNVVAFDKTGTLTKGEPEVTKVIALNGVDERSLITYVCSAEKRSEHPLSKAIVRKSSEILTSPCRDPQSYVSIPGQGVMATVDGVEVLVGNEDLMEEFDVKIPAEVVSLANAERNNGSTVVYVAFNRSIVGLITLADELKEDAREVVRYLKEVRKVKTVIITGDNRVTAKAIASKLGVDEVYYEVRPDDKVEVIEELQSRGLKVAMVGDGINDAAAISKANVGIAVGRASDITKESGDIILVSENLRNLISIFKLSDVLRRKIFFNIIWAFMYNIALLPIAMGLFYQPFKIMIKPEYGALAMVLSDISVISYALTLRKWKPE